MGFVRSGDRPAGNAAATDQSSAATEVTGNPEDIGADGLAATVQPTAQASEAGEPAAGPDRDEPAAEDRPGLSEDRDSPWAPGGGGSRSPGLSDLPDPPDSPLPNPPDSPWSSDPAGPSDAPGPPGAPGSLGPPGAPGSLASADSPGSAGPSDLPGSLGGSEEAGQDRRDQARGGPGPEAAPAGSRPTASRAGAARLGARTGFPAPGQRSGQRPERRPRYPDAAGAGFARITVLPAILIVAWLLVGLPLLLAGVFLPAPMLLLSVPLAVLLAGGLNRMPARWPRALPGAVRAPGTQPRRESSWPAWCGLVGTIVVAAGFAFWQFRFNSETVIVLRDPGAYLQTGYWIAQHGSLPIPQSLAAFGGAHPGLAFSSTGFAASGTSVVPRLMSGLPLLLAGAFWVHGTPAAAAMGPILGGLAVLAFGGLVGRLTGPQWAPAGALVLACTLPEQYTSRASFGETAVQVLLFGGLSLVVDALVLGRRRVEPAPSASAGGPVAPGPYPAARARYPAAKRLGVLSAGRGRGPAWALMGLGGLALGMTSVVGFDGLLYILPAIPFVGILVVRRSRKAAPLCIGLAIGAAYGLADGYLLARPFVDSLQPMPELIGLIAAWLLAMTVAGVELLRLPGFRDGLRPVLARRPARWLPDLCGVLAVAAIVGLAIRPYVQTVRGPATGATASLVASLQRLEHLPVDPGRLYAEDTLYWVIWYVGVPAVLLGGFGLALLLRRCLRALFAWRDPSGAARVWGLPLAVICCGSAAVLWQPETAPDQPWASRRLVPLVIPGLILCAIWASAWLRGRARSRGASTTAASIVAAFCVAALLVPTVATTFGLGLTHSGRGGALRLTADGLALKRTSPGEDGAVTRLCSSLGPSASVVIVALPVAQQFTQVIRGMCGVPAASMAGQPTAAVQTVLASIEHAGRRPVLLGARPSQLYPYGGGSPLRVLDLSTSQDPHTLTQPPTTLSPADYVIWMSAIGPLGTRA